MCDSGSAAIISIIGVFMMRASVLDWTLMWWVHAGVRDTWGGGREQLG